MVSIRTRGARVSFGTIRPHSQLQILLVQDCASRSRGVGPYHEEEESWSLLTRAGLHNHKEWDIFQMGLVSLQRECDHKGLRAANAKTWQVNPAHRKEGPISIYTTVMKNNSYFERFLRRLSDLG